MINLNDRRKHPLDAAQVHKDELPKVDLETIQAFDWIEGIGPINDFAVIGLFRQMKRAGYKITINEP